jgi:hypothetical protein
MNRYLVAAAALAASLDVSPALACAIHGTNAGNTVGTWVSETAESHIGHLTITDNLLMPPEQRTVCVCGIGLGSAGNPLPPGVTVTGVTIVIRDSATGETQRFAPFRFAPSASMTAGLQRVARQTSTSGDRPLVAGSSWFGFASSVAPFELPRLGPGQEIAFEYDISVPKDTLPFALEVQFAAGEGLADGSPDFEGAHPVTCFAAGNRSVTLSAPAATTLAPIRARPAQPERQPTQPQRQPTRPERQPVQIERR